MEAFDLYYGSEKSQTREDLTLLLVLQVEKVRIFRNFTNKEVSCKTYIKRNSLTTVITKLGKKKLSKNKFQRY